MCSRLASRADPESPEFRISPARTLEEIDAVSSLQGEIWGSSQIAAPGTLLKVIAEAGGVVLLARAGGRPVGFAYGFVGRTTEGVTYLRSHSAGVLPEYRNSGIGRELKLAQREAVLAAGMDRIVWTFDPTQVGNAHFNLRRLGATARDFRHDYYGRRDDALSQGLPTDRLIVEWFLGLKEESELAKLRRRRNLVAVAVPEGLPGRPGSDRGELHGLQAELREKLQSAFARGLQIIDYQADSRSYQLAELPSSFPARLEGGSASER